MMLSHRCELKIATESAGAASLFRSEGVLEREDGGERVRYRIEGDEGELFFNTSFLEMRRGGGCGLKARFREGEESELLLSTSASEGKIPLRTIRYRLNIGRDARDIELKYELFGFENIQTFLLKIQIKFFSEEK